MGRTFASTKRINTIKQKDMNTTNALSFISSMAASESSYDILMDMINEMDLEITDVCLA